ncbi:MAG TPA: hypothetical protein QGH10_21970, partial [Armatimonadota bacterium]|nr:hypothetical protein [Armatimonadota bacterium]
RFEPTSARYARFVVKGSTPQHWHRIADLRIGDLPYRPTPQAQWWTRRWDSGPPSEARVEAVALAYGDIARAHLATLIARGTDRYGSVQAPIWVLNLDLDTLDCFPRYNDALIEKAAIAVTYSSTAPYGVGHRAIRGSQRESGCSNLYVDQPTIRAALLNEALTGGSASTPAVEAYVRWWFDNLLDDERGLLEWGVHTSYDVHADHLKHGDGYQHEVLGILPMWPLLTRVESERAPAYMERLWYWHTDPETGIVDRHATRGKGLDFAMAAGEVILASAVLHARDVDGPWLDRALQVAHAHWDTRDPDTDLVVNTPHGGTGERFDNLYSDTTVTGFWANRVLIAGRITGCEELTEMARQTLRAWAMHGWDEEARMPWASLRPDGTPNTKPRDYEGTTYDKFDPSGHWDLWKDYVYGFEAPFATLMTYAAAAEWLDDPVLEAHAVRLGECYRAHLPANGRLGTFAANYGQLASFFLAMGRITGDTSYRKTAKRVADEAVSHLWTGRMLRGFAGREHYTAIEGPGYLAQALLELGADPTQLAEAQQDPFLWNF